MDSAGAARRVVNKPLSGIVLRRSREDGYLPQKLSIASQVQTSSPNCDVFEMQTPQAYSKRKQQEISLLDSCLSTPLKPSQPASVAAAIELKFRLAALLKADQVIGRWSITETARPPARCRNAGPFAFNFGYQRADLEVRGPPIYGSLEKLCSRCHKWTIYAGSGMSAISALSTACLQLSDTIDVVIPADCYVETRELFASLGPRIRTVPPPSRIRGAFNKTAARILWLDSSVRCSFSSAIDAITPEFDLVVFDTTCFWRGSRKINRAVRRAVRMGIPTVLVRSHAKLDTLGIEYGRLGSAVVMMPKAGSARSSWTTSLVPKLRDAVRLFGAAPALANFPPFENSAEYRACSMARTASIIRSSRGLARVLASRLPWVKVTTFQHGLYLLMAIGSNPNMEEVRRTADEMAADVAARELPVKHAGSFGFDFVGVEWYPDPIDRINSIRISGADLPLELSDEIGYRIAAWWFRHLAEKSRYPMSSARAEVRRSSAIPV